SFLGPVDWDDSWDGAAETPFRRSSPLSVPQLGLAYWVNSRVVAVEKGSPADKAGLQAGDVVHKIRFKGAGKKPGESSWGSWTELQSQRGKEKLYDEWGGAFQRMQNVDFPEVGLQVRRDGETLKEPLLVTLGEDRTWPLAQRGLILAP